MKRKVKNPHQYSIDKDGKRTLVFVILTSERLAKLDRLAQLNVRSRSNMLAVLANKAIDEIELKPEKLESSA